MRIGAEAGFAAQLVAEVAEALLVEAAFKIRARIDAG